MIVLLGVGEAVTEAVVAAAPDGEIRTPGAVPPAVRLLRAGGIDVLVVDRDGVAHADALLADVREGAFGDPRLPLVLRTDGPLPAALPVLAYDEVLDGDAAPDAVAGAVAEALRVAAYSEAVEDLYEQCRDRATREADTPGLGGLGPARDAADRALADLDPATLADLLWVPGERPAREHFASGAGGERGVGDRCERGEGSE